MSESFNAKPWHLLWAALFLTAGAAVVIGNPWAGVGLMGLGILAAVWITIAGIADSYANATYSAASLAKEIRDLPPENYRALGIILPELRLYPGRDRPIVTLEDTGIPMAAFQQFVEDSDTHQFAPERLYGDGTIARRQWGKVAAFLVDRRYLIPNSAAGNHGLLWRAGRRDLLIHRYFGVDPAIKDLEATDGQDSDS